MDFIISLTGVELDVVLAGLNELPLKVSRETDMKIRQQAQAQIDAVNKPVEPNDNEKE